VAKNVLRPQILYAILSASGYYPEKFLYKPEEEGLNSVKIIIRRHFFLEHPEIHKHCETEKRFSRIS